MSADFTGSDVSIAGPGDDAATPLIKSFSSGTTYSVIIKNTSATVNVDLSGDESEMATGGYGDFFHLAPGESTPVLDGVTVQIYGVGDDTGGKLSVLQWNE